MLDLEKFHRLSDSPPFFQSEGNPDIKCLGGIPKNAIRMMMANQCWGQVFLTVWRQEDLVETVRVVLALDILGFKPLLCPLSTLESWAKLLNLSKPQFPYL